MEDDGSPETILAVFILDVAGGKERVGGGRGRGGRSWWEVRGGSCGGPRISSREDRWIPLGDSVGTLVGSLAKSESDKSRRRRSRILDNKPFSLKNRQPGSSRGSWPCAVEGKRKQPQGEDGEGTRPQEQTGPVKRPALGRAGHSTQSSLAPQGLFDLCSDAASAPKRRLIIGGR